MKKALTSALVLTFAVVLSFVLATTTAAKKDDGKDKHKKVTILETVCRQDGTQVLCASITVVDTVGCPVGSALLDDKKANLVMLAPSNSAFEEFLYLPPGALEGKDVYFIELALPGYLERVDLEISDLCRLLQRHISKSQGKKGKTVQELLEGGSITMHDGSEVPVAIGRGGATVDYQGPITERDVFTVNGVIQYLDKVLVEAPEEETDWPPPPTDPPSDPIDLWCSRDLCEENEDLYNECVNFMTLCLLEANTDADREQCAGAGLFMCSELELF
jgi:uncharacterized surface protein with fasciclin (FAS1) repeats